MQPVDLVLKTVFSHRISEPNVEAAFERFQALTGDGLDEGAFRDAIAACVRNRLMRDPVRLEEGALQCHWRAELTPAGVEAARAAAPPPSCPRMRVSTTLPAAKEDVDTRIRGHDGGSYDDNDLGPIGTS